MGGKVSFFWFVLYVISRCEVVGNDHRCDGRGGGFPTQPSLAHIPSLSLSFSPSPYTHPVQLVIADYAILLPNPVGRASALGIG